MRTLGRLSKSDVEDIEPSESSKKPGVALITGGKPGDQLFHALQRKGVSMVDMFVGTPGLDTDSVTSFDGDDQLMNLMLSSDAKYFLVAFYSDHVPSSITRKYGNKIWGVHASLLPEFPGPDPVGAMVEAGLQYGGVTVHHLDNVIDAGDVIGSRRFSFGMYKAPEVIMRRQVVPHAAALVADIVKAADKRGEHVLVGTPQVQLIGRSNIEYICRSTIF